MRVRRDMMKDGSLLCRSFDYTPPRFGFTPRQREILRMARAGESNSAIRAQIGISETAFKKHWDRIYAKVREVMPELLPAPDDDGRGKVSRLALTYYLQKRPEELRP